MALSVTQALNRARSVAAVEPAGIDPTDLEQAFTGIYGSQPVGDLADFYCASIRSVGDYVAVLPSRRRPFGAYLDLMTDWMADGALGGRIPIFSDGCGNYFATDARAARADVVFFEMIISDQTPAYTAASSLPHFLIWLAEVSVRGPLALARPDAALELDPDLAEPRAVPPLWLAD